MTDKHEDDGQLAWLPAWITRLSVPIWISDPDRRICFLNARAEALLGRRASACLGRPCHEVVQGWMASRRPLCGVQCPLAAAARADRSLAPIRIRVGGAGSGENWIQLLCIPLWSPEGRGPWLVHCALRSRRPHDMEEYLARVATRTRSHREGGGSPDWRRLTRRELEVLRLLVRDLDVAAIARELHVSLVTVRNHVQHILVKVDAHSVQEVVARYLLTRETSGLAEAESDTMP